MNEVVSVRNINFYFDKKPVLKNISFNISHKDCVALIGPNGAGKTTLIKLLAGLLKPSKGKIELFGKEINSEIKKQIGYIPQNISVDNFMPILVQDVLYMGFLAKNGMFKKYSKQDVSLVEEVAKKLDIFKLMQKPIYKISGGERQKVSIARVLLQNAKILLMDEPLANIDISYQKDILKIINDTHLNKNITSLIIVHNLHQIPSCCNKIMFVSEGEISAFENKETFFGSDKFNKLWNF